MKHIYLTILNLNKWFKFGIGVLLLNLIATVSTPAQSPTNQIFFTEDEKAWISENPTVKASSSTLYAPFDFNRSGLPAGLSIDYLGLVSQKVGLKVEYVKYVDFPNSLAGAINNEVDIIHSTGKNQQRATQFLFSKPYFEDTFANFGRVGSQRITSIEDLKKLRIGIVKTHMVADVYKKKYPDFNLIEYDNYLDVKSGLLLNEVDVFTGNNSVVEFFISQNNIQGLEKIGDDLVMDNVTSDLHIAVQKNNQILMDIINKGMSAVTDEEFRQIVEKWIKLPAVNYDIDLTAESQAWIIDHPIVKVSNNTLNAPIDFVSAGQPAGLSIDYLNLLAEIVGLKIDYVRFENFPSAFAAAINNEVDIIHSISKNAERDKLFLFSSAYMEVSIANYGHVGSQRINSISDLEGKKIGILKNNFIADAYKKNYPDLNLIEYPTYREAINALAMNEIDVFTGDASVIEYYISQNNIQGLAIIGNDYAMKDVPYFQHIAVQKDNQILMDLINKAMASVTHEEFDRIAAKWISLDRVFHDIGLTSEELEWLDNNKTVITASEQNTTPFEFINNTGKIDGLTGDFLNEISKRLNVDFIWAGNENWSEGLSKIKSGQIDLVPGITPTSGRNEFLTFSEIYVNYDTAIFSRLEGTHFVTLESLSGYTIAQIKGAVELEYLAENYPNINIIEVESIEDSIRLVSEGGADALTANILTTSPAILDAGVENLIITGIANYPFGNAFGTQKDLPLLASSIQKALADISPTRRQEILNKWMLLRFVPNTDYGYLWNVVFIALVILVITLIWNGKLTVARKEALASKKEAEEANTSKSKFLANMSHELRTPLNSLLLLSQNLRKNSSKNLTDKQVDHANVIHNSGSELLQMINGLLDLSKVEANKMVVNADEISFQEMSEYLYSVFQPQMNEANLDFSITIDDELPNIFVSDQQHLFQIIKNLVSNALKFTERGSISVAIKSHILPDDKNEQIKISVTDSGIGIEEGLLREIFDEFSQGRHDTMRKYGGTGLGLAISKKMAILLDGTITLKSNLGHGSTFNLFIPLIAASGLDDAVETEEFLIQNRALFEAGKVDDLNDNELILEGKTILLVDDDKRNIYSLSEVLNKYGIRSIIAQSGIQALKILKDHKEIDLILMDMMMPGMDGDEAISRIRFTARGEHLPIISLTANAMPKHRQKCLDAGANDYLTKPIDIETLLSKIRVWL